MLRQTAVALATFAALGAAHATSLGTNLIVNGDAEAGTTGWTAFSATALFGAAEYGSNWVLPTQPGPVDRGTHLFVGDSGNAYAAGFQQLSVADLSAQIDGSGLRYSLAGWLGGWTTQNDNALLYVQFFDAANTELGHAQIGPVLPADRGNATGLVLVSNEGALPVGTRSLQFSLSMERFSGGDNDGYADNLSFALQPVPEPQSAALLAAGLTAIGLMALRGNRRR